MRKRHATVSKGRSRGSVGSARQLQKLAEEKLRAKEEQLRAIMNSLTNHIAVLDTQGAIVAVNEAWSRFALANDLQRSPAEWIGVNYFDVCRQAASHDEMVRDLLRGLEDVCAGLRPSFELEYPCHSEVEQRWFRLCSTPLHGTTGGLVVSHENVTERKRAQDFMRTSNVTLEQRVKEQTSALAEANERLDWVMRATHDSVWDWDFVHDTVYYSARWKEMHGFQSIDMMEPVDEWSGRIHPDDRERVLGRLQDHLFGRAPEFWEEYRIRRKNGTWMWVLDRGTAVFDDQGRAVRMVGAETDITWRKEAEEASFRREHEFHTLADNVPAFFSYVDRDRRYRFVNKQYEKLFHRPADQFVGSTMQDVLGPDGYAVVQPYLDAAFGGDEVSFEYQLPLRDGREQWFSARYMPERDEQGRAVGLFILLADVTPLKRTEADLREKKQQLGDLSARLLQAQEEEQRRIAQELHDDVTQRLAALAIDVRMVQRDVSGA